MKKIIFSILAVAALSVSCIKFAEDGTIDFKEAASPEVTAKTLADDQIEVSVTAKEGTSFFSYIVAKGAAVQTDAETLLKGKSSLVALKYKIADKDGETIEKTAAEVLDYTKVQDVKLTIGGLASNTAYTVYAVASNAQGVVSKVAVATITTTDGTAPKLLLDKVKSQEEDSVLFVALQFDDPIALSGKGGVTAHFYAAYTTPDAEGNLVAQKTVELTQENECLEAEGDVLYVTIPKTEYTPGAIVTFTYPAGIVTNALGAGCAAFEDADVSAERKTKGIAATYKTVSFKISVNEDGDKEDDGNAPAESEGGEEEENGPIVFTDWEKLVMLSYSQSAYPLEGTDEGAEVTISVVDANDRTVTYKAQTFKAIDTKKIGVILNEDPGYGVYVSYKIAAGSFLDIYGNTNEEFSVEKGYYCSYGYKVADILGTYTLSGLSPFEEEDVPVSYPLEIKASDNEEYGNVMITNVLGFTEGAALYCEFDGDAGTLLIYEGDIFIGNKTAGYCTFFNQAGDKTCIFEPGKITLPGIFIIATVAGGKMSGYATDKNGKVGVYNGVATKQ